MKSSTENWSACPDCGVRYKCGMWAKQSHDQNHCKPKLEQKRKADEEEGRRQKALNRILARELVVIAEEDTLTQGLARGHYDCPKCGKTRGWRIEENYSKFSGKSNLPTYTTCACGDRPYFAHVSGYCIKG